MTVLGRLFHQGCERETTLGRAAAGLVVGGLAGAGLTGAAGVMGGPLAFFVFLFALPVWFAGLFLIAAPGWWVLHRLGARCQQAAMIYGGGLTFAVVTLFGAWQIWRGAMNDWGGVLGFATALAVAGIAVGWIVGRVAYGPPTPKSAPPLIAA